MNEMESLKEEIKKLDVIIAEDKEYLKKHPEDIIEKSNLKTMERLKRNLIFKNTPIEEKPLEDELIETQEFNKKLQKLLNEDDFYKKHLEKTLIDSKKYEKLLTDEINQKNYKNELNIKNDVRISK